jgi:hypothetical protein
MRSTTRTQSRHIVRTIACASLLGVIGAAGAARAQGNDTTTAEALFRQGKQALDAKDYAKACPMLAESYRLDPATGAMLALATCHEQQGKLASAWSEFTEAASRSQREGRADRVAVAKERQQALEPRLSTLTIVVADAVAVLPGFELRRDGVVLGRAVLGAPVPVDGGDHTVEVAATGKQAFKTRVVVGKEKDKAKVEVASLEDDATAKTPKDATKPGAAVSLSASSVAPSSRLTDMQIAGLIAGGVGVVGIAVGSAFGLTAISKNNDSKNDCASGVCTTSAAQQARDDARAAGTVSTIAFVAGGVLAAAGVTLFVVGKQKRAETTGVSVAPAFGANGGGLSLQGVF